MLPSLHALCIDDEALPTGTGDRKKSREESDDGLPVSKVIKTTLIPFDFEASSMKVIGLLKDRGLLKGRNNDDIVCYIAILKKDFDALSKAKLPFKSPTKLDYTVFVMSGTGMIFNREMHYFDSFINPDTRETLWYKVGYWAKSTLANSYIAEDLDKQDLYFAQEKNIANTIYENMKEGWDNQGLGNHLDPESSIQ